MVVIIGFIKIRFEGKRTCDRCAFFYSITSRMLAIVYQRSCLKREERKNLTPIQLPTAYFSFISLNSSFLATRLTFRLVSCPTDSVILQNVSESLSSSIIPLIWLKYICLSDFITFLK